MKAGYPPPKSCGLLFQKFLVSVIVLRSDAPTTELSSIRKVNPFQKEPPFEKLVGDLAGAYSRRINIHHRLVYQIYKKEKTIKIIRMWTHYE